MRRLGFMTLGSALVVLPACVLDHGLGQTAEGGSSGDTAGEDTSDSGLDPSATSGQVPGSTSGGESTGADPIPDPGDSSGTDGDPSCDHVSFHYVDWAQDFSQPLPGLEVEYAAVLGGQCTLGEPFGAEGKRGMTWLWELPLECSLSGRLDGDAAVVDLPASILLQGTAGMPLAEWIPPFGDQPLQLRVVIDNWGWGWNRYLMLHRGADVMLDLVDAEHPDPRDGISWLEDIDALIGEQPWHDTIAVGVVEAECNTAIGRCGEIPKGMEIGWVETGSYPTLHGSQGATFGATVRDLFYRTWLSSAQDLSMPLCTDMPLGDYRFAVWGREP